MDFQMAVVDRIEDTQATLMVGEAGSEHIVSLTELPEGVAEGTWLRVSFEGDRLAKAEIDAEETARAASRIKQKMARLRRRGRAPPRT